MKTSIISTEETYRQLIENCVQTSHKQTSLAAGSMVTRRTYTHTRAHTLTTIQTSGGAQSLKERRNQFLLLLELFALLVYSVYLILDFMCFDSLCTSSAFDPNDTNAKENLIFYKLLQNKQFQYIIKVKLKTLNRTGTVNICVRFYRAAGF